MSTSALPGHPFVHYSDGNLCVEGLALDALAHTHGTPLFVYSKAAMLSALAAYQRGFVGRQAQICYAMKANSTLGVLQVFAQAGCGFDIVSAGRALGRLPFPVGRGALAGYQGPGRVF